MKTTRFALGALALAGVLAAVPVGATAAGTASPTSPAAPYRPAADVLCALTAHRALGSRSAAIAWARSHGAAKLSLIPPSDGQAHYVVDLEGGSLELIGPEPALQRISWMGDSSAFDEWASFLDHYAPGQARIVAGVLGDTRSESPDASVALADRTLRVMAIRGSNGTLLLLAVKAGTDREPGVSRGPSGEPGLGTQALGMACGVLA